MQDILIADNDVIVNIFDTLQQRNKEHFKQTISHLSLQYSQIWIPAEVEREFIGHHLESERKKRMKILKTIYGKYQFISQCPIPVSKNEINIDNNFSEENKGETDAILQASKALSIADNKFHFKSICLLFRDRAAIKKATKRNLVVLEYTQLAEQLREVGIILPI